MAGEFNRNELAILGTTCSNIRDLANSLTGILANKHKVAYVDADHQASVTESGSALAQGADMEFIDKISHRSIGYHQQFNSFQQRSLFNEQDLVLINGNHFKAQSQIVVIDPAKPLDNKLDKLTDVKLILLSDGMEAVPGYLQQHLPLADQIPVYQLSNISAIAGFVESYISSRVPSLHGLVLAGGQSQRMQTDKGSIAYYGKSQRLHVYDMLQAVCQEVFVSYADAASANAAEQLPIITDTFTGLGPFGGILSAFRVNPNAAWLTLACDLPYLSAETLAYLVQHRNPSKIATAFSDTEGKFPEPLITIWEPRSYLVMLQFLAQGYSCPRKVLINSDIELLQAPNPHDFTNVNYPQEKEAAMQQLQSHNLPL
jgi:molybdopterin-guanine dinucleotide biosynthesis protein A